jgi:hypothetical protein
LRFSRNQFFRTKKGFSPLFSETVGPIGLKIFLQVLQLIWDACFFWFWDILFLKKLAAFTIVSTTAKTKTFREVLSILLRIFDVDHIFQKKKNTHPKLVELPVKKFSAEKNEISGFAGGKTLGQFWTLWPPEVHEDEVWQICVHNNFCSTTQGPSTLKISRIFARPFVRNAGKGGVPLSIFSFC